MKKIGRDAACARTLFGQRFHFCCRGRAMGKTKRLFIWAILASITAFCVAATATRRGPAILHYLVRTPLAHSEIASNVTASLRLEFKQQGRSSKQKFDLRASGLERNTNYFVIVTSADDTNASSVKEVRSDSRGRVRLSYTKRGQGKGNGKRALPAEFDPVTDIGTIGLQDSQTQTIAFASIAAAPRFDYLVKRNLTKEDTNATPAGSIYFHASSTETHFTLRASGLSVSNVYLLALNSNVVETATSDGTGYLRISGWPTGAPPVLTLQSLSLLDGASNVVLSTRLPK
jgi:hypothetical protein